MKKSAKLVRKPSSYPFSRPQTVLSKHTMYGSHIFEYRFVRKEDGFLTYNESSQQLGDKIHLSTNRLRTSKSFYKFEIKLKNF
jgi:hypothetical protein